MRRSVSLVEMGYIGLLSGGELAKTGRLCEIEIIITTLLQHSRDYYPRAWNHKYPSLPSHLPGSFLLGRAQDFLIPSRRPEYRLYGTDNVEQMPQIQTVSVDSGHSTVQLDSTMASCSPRVGESLIDDGYLRPMHIDFCSLCHLYLSIRTPSGKTPSLCVCALASTRYNTSD